MRGGFRHIDSLYVDGLYVDGLYVDLVWRRSAPPLAVGVGVASV